MFNKSDLLFIPVDIEPPPAINCDYIDSLSEDRFRIDNYRNCKHLPIHYYLDGKWSFTDHFPHLNEWLNDTVWPLTGLTRVVIICTPPGETNPLHIDCSPEAFNNLQHKIRYVYRGNVDDLVFTARDREVRVPKIDSPFLMDGSWPHWMKNNSEKIKYTLAVGAPWEPEDADEMYSELLSKSYEKYSEHCILSNDLELPENYMEYYENKYKTNA